MSLFKKPKKNIQRRNLSDFTDDPDGTSTLEKDGNGDLPEMPKIKAKEAKPEKSVPKERQPQTKTLLSFGDEEGEYGSHRPSPIDNRLFAEEEEVFQVKKTSQSKKLMRQMDKERKRKAKGADSGDLQAATKGGRSDLSNKPSSDVHDGLSATSGPNSPSVQSVRKEFSVKNKIHTEIRTDDDFVVRLLLSIISPNHPKHDT